MEFECKLKDIIIKIVDADLQASDINEEMDLMDIGFDSVKVIELIVELETEFDIEFYDEDLDIDNLIIFMKLKELVQSKICKKQ